MNTKKMMVISEETNKIVERVPGALKSIEFGVTIKSVRIYDKYQTG